MLLKRNKILIIIGVGIQLIILSNLGINSENEQVFVDASTNSNLYVNFIAEVDISVGYKIRLENNRAYISSNEGIEIIDVQNPTTPIWMKTIEDGTMGFDVKDNIVYTTNSNGLITINTTLASSPEIIGSSNTGQWAYNLRVNDTLVFAIVSGDMDIYNVSNLTNPVLIGQYIDSGRGNDIIIHNEIAYYADPDEGLEVINITDCTNPEKIRTVTNTLGAWDLYINNELLYLGCHGLGFKILDISNPINPIVIKQFNDGGEVYGVCGNNSYIFLGDLQEGVEVLNNSNPIQLIEVASYTATPHDIEYQGNYIYVADQDNGFLLLELSNIRIEHTSDVQLFYGLVIIPLIGIKMIILSKKNLREKI
ncbi:MAG: LVIVD repeat-containing protein [Candidatus Thorarchaeota archaeon]